MKWLPLSDVQWMNIVNHKQAWHDVNKDEAVHEVVKMTEAKCKENNDRQWQPIASAPKDGRRVIVWAKEYVEPVTAQFYSGVGLGYEGKWGLTYENILMHQPTHWTELPVTPKD